MADGDDESSRTLWVGNLHEKVTEEILFELFLQIYVDEETLLYTTRFFKLYHKHPDAGPLERVVLPSGKRYAFITFQHKESVPYSKELMDGVQLFGQHMIMQPRTQSNNSNNVAYPATAPLIQPGVQHLMSPPMYSLPGHHYGQQMYGTLYNQYTNSVQGRGQPDVQRLARLQDVKRQLSHLPSMIQPHQPHQQQYQHQQQPQQNYRQHGTQQRGNYGRRGYH